MKRRLFLAINLPFDCREELISWQKNSRLSGLNWTAKKNLHITVLFLGQIFEEDVLALENRLNKLLGIDSKINLKFKQLCLAPSENKARMIWAEFYSNPAYDDLVNKVYQIVNSFMLKSIFIKRKILRPHITLARFKQPVGKIEWPASKIISCSIKVEELFLMESILTARRPFYRELAKFRLIK